MNTATYRQSRLMPYFLLALMLHILYFVIWVYGPLLRRQLYEMLDVQPEMQQQIDQEEPPPITSDEIAALKARYSEFGAPVMFQEDPEFTQEPPLAPESQGLEEQELEDPIEEQPDVQIEEQQATPEEVPEQPLEVAGPAPQPEPLEEPKDSGVTATRKPKPQPQRKPQLPSRPLSDRMAGPEMNNAGPVDKGLTFADIANGFLDTIRDEGGFDFVSREGNEDIRPSYEEMKYLSYHQKVAWHIQNAWRRFMHLVDDGTPEVANITFWLVIDSEGYLKDARIENSTGYASLDQLLLRTVKEASPFPPIPKHFNKEIYDMHSTWVYYRESAPRHRGRFGV